MLEKQEALKTLELTFEGLEGIFEIMKQTDCRQINNNIVNQKVELEIKNSIAKALALIIVKRTFIDIHDYTKNTISIILTYLPNTIISKGRYKFCTTFISETELPKDISKEEYDFWYKYSEIQEGVRMGFKMELINAK